MPTDKETIMEKFARTFGLIADLAPGAAILAIGVLLIFAGVIPGALLQ